MQSEKLIVIIPGSKTKESNLPLLRSLLKRFYAHFGIEVEEDHWIEPLRSHLASTQANTMVFEWTGGISLRSARKAAQDLQEVLRTRGEQEVILFGKSLGGTIAELAAQDTRLPIKRVIAVATPHSRFTKSPSSIELINIYSPADNYLRLAGRILFFGFGTLPVRGARNISLPGLRHSDFNHNLDVEYEDRKQKLFDFYRALITI